MNLSKSLPNYYWDFIMDYLPNYSSRDDVLLSDIYTRYLDGEDVLEEDINRFFVHRTRAEIENEYLSNEWDLFIEAFENFSEAKYGKDNTTNGIDFLLERLGNKAFIPQIDGAFYVTQYKAYEINDFLHECLNGEYFIFEITGPMDDEKMHHFNNLFKEVNQKGEICYDVATGDRMKYLKEIGCDLQFVKPAREKARANLILCGGLEMPLIIGGMLKKHYYENATARTSMEDCIEYLAKVDIVNYGFDNLDVMYRTKIANLLLCAFTGMKFGAEWNGRQEVNGGYIVVKNDSDVLAFHSTIADEFKDYLIAKMVMESPSHSRHKDMIIYKEGGRYFLKLDLQIRFALTR